MNTPTVLFFSLNHELQAYPMPMGKHPESFEHLLSDPGLGQEMPSLSEGSKSASRVGDLGDGTLPLRSHM